MSLGLVVVELELLGVVELELEGVVELELELVELDPESLGVVEPELGVVEVDPESLGVVEPDPELLGVVEPEPELCELVPPPCCSLWLCCGFGSEPALWLGVEDGAGAAGGALGGAVPRLTCWNGNGTGVDVRWCAGLPCAGATRAWPGRPLSGWVIAERVPAAAATAFEPAAEERPAEAADTSPARAPRTAWCAAGLPDRPGAPGSEPSPAPTPPPTAPIASSATRPIRGAPSAPEALATEPACDAAARPGSGRAAIRGATESGSGIGCLGVIDWVAIGTSGVVGCRVRQFLLWQGGHAAAYTPPNGQTHTASGGWSVAFWHRPCRGANRLESIPMSEGPPARGPSLLDRLPRNSQSETGLWRLFRLVNRIRAVV